jgi:hypothetical protein
MLKPTADRQTHWNFGDSHGNPVSMEEFLAEQEAAGFSFFEGKEPWLKGLHELNWQTFFRVCTEEMDDLSQRAIKLVDNKVYSTIGRYVIPSLKTQSRKRWPTASRSLKGLAQGGRTRTTVAFLFENSRRRVPLYDKSPKIRLQMCYRQYNRVLSILSAEGGFLGRSMEKEP